MRKIITLFALFSLAAAYGQNPGSDLTPASGREPARPRMIPAQQFDLPADRPNTYLRSVAWSREETPGAVRFTADCSVPFAWANRQVLLRIASAPGGYELAVNGRTAGHVQTGALPAEFNLTKLLKEGANRLELTVPRQHPAAALEDFDTPSATELGLSELICQPTIRIRDCIITTRRYMAGVEYDCIITPGPIADRYIAEVGIVVKSDALNSKQARIYYDLRNAAGTSVKSGFNDLTLSMRGEDTLRFVVEIPESELWSPDSPTRYRLQLRTQTAGRYTEYLTLPVGFRTVEVRDRELLLNGRPVELHIREIAGMPTAAELEELRQSQGIVLCPRPGTVSEELYDLCDELGLPVIAQSPLRSARSGLSRKKEGNPTNDPARTAFCIDRTEAAYHLAKRHPSVIGFSLARDAANGIGLYESYLNLKGREKQRPILYPEAEGEWNSDPLHIVSWQSND